MKICGKCNELKNEDEFNKNSSNKKNGLSSYCKICVRKSSKLYYNNNIPIYRTNYSKYREWYDLYKQTLKCTNCDEDHPSCLEFHHLDPNTKENGISVMINKRISKELIMDEIRKCIVLCSNCHKKLHYDLIRQNK